MHAFRDLSAHDIVYVTLMRYGKSLLHYLAQTRFIGVGAHAVTTMGLLCPLPATCLARSTFKMLCWPPTANKENALAAAGLPPCTSIMHTSCVGRDSLRLLTEAAKEKA